LERRGSDVEFCLCLGMSRADIRREVKENCAQLS
jgi:hypothetical protein